MDSMLVSMPDASITTHVVNAEELAPEAAFEEDLCPVGAVLEALQEAACVVDDRLSVRYWNAAMSRLTGVAAREALHRPLFSLFPRAFKASLETKLHQIFSAATSLDSPAFQHEPGTWSGEVQQADGSESHFLFRYRFSLLPATAARPLVLFSLVEVSHRRVAPMHRRYREQLHLLGKLSASVAHELAGALDLICIKLDEMVRAAAKAGNEQLKNDVKDLIPQVYRISSLTNNMVALGSGMAPNFARLQVNDVIRESIALMEQTLRRRIPCSLALRPDLPWVSGDPVMLHAVFQNLIKYAIDASGDDVVARIQTLASNEGSGVTIQVEDRGSAPDESLLANFFDPACTFEKLGIATGFGLFLSKKIIEAHHGTIAVYSRSGTGTQIVIGLPATK